MLASIHDDPSILVCADLQIEYLTPGRRHVILDGDGATARCLELLTLWRANLWPVMHLKRIAQAAWFNPASRLTDWIAEMKPRPGELTFEHPLPSAYSSSRYVDYMNWARTSVPSSAAASPSLRKVRVKSAWFLAMPSADTMT